MPSINVIDMSHHNRPKSPDFAALLAAGVFGVIHKASQGAEYRDSMYSSRRKAAMAAGMLWGAYHFLTSAPVKRQVDNFLEASEYTAEDADDKILLCADYEDEPNGNSASLKQCMEFIAAVERESGVSVVLYSGNRIRETLTPRRAGAHDVDMADAPRFFQLHRLWLAQYGPKAKTPWPWSEKIAVTANQETALPAPGVWLWQFTERGRVNPLVGNTDGNFYDGDFAKLSANWVR